MDYSSKSILYGTFYAFIAAIALVILLFILNRLFRKLNSLIETRYKARIQAIHIKSFEIVQAHPVRTLVEGTAKLLRFFIILILPFAYLDLLLSFFPRTRPFAGQG